MMCEHNFVHGGVKYAYDSNIPGSISNRYCFEWFYCERCLTYRYVRICDMDMRQLLQRNATLIEMPGAEEIII